MKIHIRQSKRRIVLDVFEWCFRYSLTFSLQSPWRSSRMKTD